MESELIESLRRAVLKERTMTPKPGLSTSEFILVVIVLAVANVLAVLAAAYTDVEALKVASACAAAVVDTLVTIGYIVARTKVKTESIRKSGSGGFMHAAGTILILLFLACMFMFLTAGCSVDELWVDSSIATYDAVAPEYIRYVDADPALSPEQKSRRHDTVNSWARKNEEWKATLGKK